MEGPRRERLSDGLQAPAAWYDRPKATRHALMVQGKPALLAAQLPYLDAMANTLEAILRD